MIVVDVAAIPAELRARAQWVCWKLEPNPVPGKKDKKPPYIPGTDFLASSTKPEHWRSFDVALRAYQAGKGIRYQGLSYALVAGGGLVFVDIDNCIDAAGDMTPEARAMIAELGSYAERSPGNGIHILANGTIAGRGRHRGNLEIYAEDRFVTVTGAHIAGTPASPCSVNGPLDRLYASIAPPALPRSDESSVGQSWPQLADHEVLARAGKNAIFAALYAGDTFGYGEDESAATLALCARLAYWCQGDRAQIDRLFRGSGLMRPKWDSRRGGGTWGSGRIDKACSGSFRAEYRGPTRSDDSSDRERGAMPSTMVDDSEASGPDRDPHLSAPGLAPSARTLARRLAALEAENAALQTAAAAREARIAELARRLETAECALDRVRLEAPAATIERLERRLAEEQQAHREIVALARDTALLPTTRVTGIIFKEAGQAFRSPERFGDETAAPRERRVHVAALEVEAGIGKGSAARHVKLLVARGHFKYRVVAEDTPANQGPPRSVALIAPGDALLRSVVDLRRQRERDAKERERAARERREQYLQSRVAELQTALERATSRGCTLCGGPLVPTGYHCPACGVEHSTADLARLADVSGVESHPSRSDESSDRVGPRRFVGTGTDGRAPPGDAWLERGVPGAF